MEVCRQYLLLVANQEIHAELRPKGGASDLVQETFLEAQRDFAGFRGSSERELMSWLRQILLHNVANFSRQYCHTEKRQISREISLGTDESNASNIGRNMPARVPSPVASMVQSEERIILERALSRLPPHYAKVIEMRHQEGRTFEEIGVALERSSEAVRKLWARAIELLQVELDAQPRFPSKP
jgi:RNA polymerase sigma-70 factor (ECF subfamily)